ncbi:ribosome silencing factor [Maliponia aquimaris]|uniref:Ribosomal silencing factor RsfS n=1 Tax=Maliponia aquimaris TaxID=1673631 RepID=A0A238KE45_9RHOB|nr:ribosome silencing factor [Maliponia aquimaris]SMX40744.1 Ribosomal silencing factor RsfS [Maliponia aquimaris]
MGWLWRITQKEETTLSSTTLAAHAAEQGRGYPAVTQSGPNAESTLAAVLEILSDNKAEDIVQIDLRGKSSVCDYMVIASGRSSRQVAALSEKVADGLKHDHGLLSTLEGKDTGDWVLIDAGDVVVHVFRPEVREFYQLEKMWAPLGTLKV